MRILGISLAPSLITMLSHSDPGLFVPRTLSLGSISVAGGRAPRSPPPRSRHDAARDDPKRRSGAECRDTHATAKPVLGPRRRLGDDPDRLCDGQGGGLAGTPTGAAAFR